MDSLGLAPVVDYKPPMVVVPSRTHDVQYGLLLTDADRRCSSTVSLGTCVGGSLELLGYTYGGHLL